MKKTKPRTRRPKPITVVTTGETIPEAPSSAIGLVEPTLEVVPRHRCRVEFVRVGQHTRSWWAPWHDGRAPIHSFSIPLIVGGQIDIWFFLSWDGISLAVVRHEVELREVFA